MSQRVEFTWKSLAEASEEASRKFTWAAVGFFVACAGLTYFLISTHVRYVETCAYIGSHVPAGAVQQVEEYDFARTLLQEYCA
jgi:hypothetical protein